MALGTWADFDMQNRFPVTTGNRDTPVFHILPERGDEIIQRLCYLTVGLRREGRQSFVATGNDDQSIGGTDHPHWPGNGSHTGLLFWQSPARLTFSGSDCRTTVSGGQSSILSRSVGGPGLITGQTTRLEILLGS